MVDIRDIIVYDPKNDGYDLTAYLTEVDPVKSAKFAGKILDRLYKKLRESRVEGDKTLENFLYANDGYFLQRPTVKAVVFMDGRFHSEYDASSGADENLFHTTWDVEHRDKNAIPFVLHNPDKK